MVLNWMEYVGYIASILILVSLLMSSILKLRWISLSGSIMYAIYGFLIGSWPVALTNIATTFINLYYLVKIYRSYNTKEYFKLLEIDYNSEYFDYFLDYYRDGIKNSVTNYDFTNNENSIGFYILRNLVPAGIYLGKKYDDTTLLVDLDFVIPEYRDFKIGHHIYDEQIDYFLNLGYSRIISFPHSQNYENYLLRMGFKEKEENGRKIFEKNLTPKN